MYTSFKEFKLKRLSFVKADFQVETIYFPRSLKNCSALMAVVSNLVISSSKLPFSVHVNVGLARLLGLVSADVESDPAGD